METYNDMQNEMDYNDDTKSTISSITVNSDYPSSSCQRRKIIEKEIQRLATRRVCTKSSLAFHMKYQLDGSDKQIKFVSNVLEETNKELDSRMNTLP
ncbi:hypothetical protein NPIL_169341 [Nephila pilipes]|uniref:Uncharacterized protein n=1 Tax=Nephila pilipes TaxID=299642 RepID=A0A8X6UA75_NEPPI|nr:hypothetical protein NPIL_169341 [Nephila pilipes]